MTEGRREAPTAAATLLGEWGPVDAPVRAAGVLPWRRPDGRLQVAVVHRPKYDDWSWPKGKLEPGEPWPAAAVRETQEETGLLVRLGLPLPPASYEVGTRGRYRPKVVRYWAACVEAEDGEPLNEVDRIEWLAPDDARRLLTYRRDRVQLDALIAADADDAVTTWPLAVVRHASAVRRRSWRGDDRQRPLDTAGKRRATDLVPILGAYGVTRVLSSPAERCAATLVPYAEATGGQVRLRDGLTEDAFKADSDRPVRALDKAIARAEPTALCTHRPVLPGLLLALADRACRPAVADALRESAGPGLVKGEVLVAHLHGVGDEARVVAVERHDVR
jgi:8-oxo-dGTP pyrophosphatase MutT (NUDIX family)/phosphohistidine phosphatase SixA